MVAWAGRELAVAHGPQLAAQGLLGHGDAELLPDPLDEIDQPQRTAPWTAGIGPLSTAAASAAGWGSLSFAGSYG